MAGTGSAVAAPPPSAASLLAGMAQTPPASTPFIEVSYRHVHATLGCVASALLVFGVLALSSVPVLRAIGLTVALGVAFHFTLSVLMAPAAHLRREA